MYQKRILTAAVLLVSLAGVCFASAQSEQAASKSEPVTVTVWMGSWWQDDIPKVVAAYQAEHPDRKLTIEPVPINGYLEKAVAACLGGNPPDVLSLDAGRIAAMAGRDLLLPWDDYVKDLDVQDFNQGMWNASKLNGKLYALPYRGSSGVYFYNKTMFDGAGLDYPKEGWTYQDMLSVAQKITVQGEKYGVGIAASLSDPANVFSSFAPVLWAFGGEFLTEDNKKALINQPGGVAGITFWTDLYTKYHVVPEGSINFAISKDVVPLFINDKVALFPGTSAQFGQLLAAGMPQEKWFTVVSPQGWNAGGGWAYSLPKGAAHTAEGREFARWFVEPRNQEKLMIRQPARASATNVAPWNTPEYAAVFRASKWTRTVPITPAWNEMSTAIITELQRIMQQTKTPQQGADDMAKAMNEAAAKQQ